MNAPRWTAVETLMAVALGATGIVFVYFLAKPKRTEPTPESGESVVPVGYKVDPYPGAPARPVPPPAPPIMYLEKTVVTLTELDNGKSIVLPVGSTVSVLLWARTYAHVKLLGKSVVAPEEGSGPYLMGDKVTYNFGVGFPGTTIIEATGRLGGDTVRFTVTGYATS